MNPKPIHILSAEPLVGLKQRYGKANCPRPLLSAEPLVGLKQDADGNTFEVEADFQPNPSWV